MQQRHERSSVSSCGASFDDAAAAVRPPQAAARPSAGPGPAAADVLSDVLRAVRLTGAVYFDFDLSSPWVAESPPAREIASYVMPRAQRVIEYHLVARGGCWAQVIGRAPIRVEEGDVVVFPQGHAHVLSSAPGMRCAPDLSAFALPSVRLPMFQELGGGGDERARVVCCFLGCDERPCNPLLSALPDVIHLPFAAARATTGWLSTLLTTAAREARDPRPGGDNVLSRLSELMFVETIRHYLETLPGRTGWLAGLRDPLIGRALAALHADPRARWTVERLARAAGVCRSVLAERFTATVGQPPMQYLASWRMQLASRLLTDGERVGAVAGAVGYESEAAFSRAFKKAVGRAPSEWRGRDE